MLLKQKRFTCKRLAASESCKHRDSNSPSACWFSASLQERVGITTWSGHKAPEGEIRLNSDRSTASYRRRVGAVQGLFKTLAKMDHRVVETSSMMPSQSDGWAITRLSLPHLHQRFVIITCYERMNIGEATIGYDVPLVGKTCVEI